METIFNASSFTIFNASSFTWIKNQGKSDLSYLQLEEMPRSLKVRKNDGEVRTFVRTVTKFDDEKTVVYSVYHYGGFYITLFNQ